MSLSTCVSRSMAAAAAVALLAGVPALAAAQDTVTAVWVPKSTHFIYQGFTTRYTCSGLRDEVRSMLRKLGAQDLHVQEVPCSTPSGVPSPFPGVTVRMRVLVPASSPQAAKLKSAGAPVQAHWKNVVLMPSNAGFEDQGNCELIEEFKESFLPLFTTRNVKYGSTCVPYQLTMGTHLSAEVLMPPPKKR
ncbi:MAG TPA: hypothetical protein VFN79_05550 [Steroidobacteraceae bacterium]|nr:hypothetical protein [Steroidobacteraceae bacterium]